MNKSTENTSNIGDYIPNSFIKNVAFELPPNFKYDNSPLENIDDGYFFGRKKETEEFLHILSNSKRDKGVFLVAGYRGVGKTSFVKNVIDKYKENKKDDEEKRDVIKIDLHISSPDIKEIDILRQVTSQLRREFEKRSKTKERVTKYQNKQNRVGVFTLLAILICWLMPYLLGKYVLPLWDFWKKVPSVDVNDTVQRCIAYPQMIIPLVFISLYFYFNYSKRKYKNDEGDPLYALDELYNRAYSTVSKEKSSSIKLSSIPILKNLELSGDKETQSYPLASSKELEQELIRILALLNKDGNEKYFKEGVVPEVIFVFDELDKVSLAKDEGGLYEDLETFQQKKQRYSYNVDENRSRKSAVINILGNLKSFLTQADARFIFIAGREMYDAALADVSDRQSLLSSIFSYTFYLNSFLKEESTADAYKNKNGITDIIGEYLFYVLTCCDPDTSPICSDLKCYYDEFIDKKHVGHGTCWDEYEKRKAMFMLQKLLIYLAYRSNGSPKKLSTVLYSLIQIKTFANSEDYSAFCKRNIVIEYEKNTTVSDNETKCYLLIEYPDQYRVGFINYLFRPFIINKGKNLKTMSDNTLVTTPYVMDHLIKFHPFAFSINNLEQIPEVISPSSTQAFRNYVKSLVEYLSLNHIRETHVNLFSYKFISKSENELNYITLKFEEEAAGFNFTLDESYPVKIYLRRKIKMLRSIFLNNPPENRQVYSISFLNGWLGDLDFFDQQYDDAITEYSDAIKEITARDFDRLNFRDFSLLVNFKLKQGLCFEKMKAYYEAISFYTDAINNTKGFLDFHIDQQKREQKKKQTQERNYVYSTSVIKDLLQVINQSFIAKAYAQEKMSFNGFDLYKAKHNLESFVGLIDKINIRVRGNNYLTLANYFLNIGNLLYYKNHRISETDIDDVLLNGIKLFSVENVKQIMKDLNAFESKEVDPEDLMLSGDKRSTNFAMLYYVLSLICIKRFYTIDEEAEQEYVFYVKNEGRDGMEGAEKNCDLGKYKKVYHNNEGKLSNIISDIRGAKCENRYAKKILASVLSNIGNTLTFVYAVYDGKDDSPVHEITEDFSHATNAKLLEISSDEPRTLEYILTFYKWSSELFDSSGIKVSASFQLRKMMYLLRTIITEKNAGRVKDKEKLLLLIREHVLLPLYNFNSQISDIADKKQYQKYIKTLGAHIPDWSKDLNEEDKGRYISAKDHIDDSLSNHPDDREVQLLYYHLKMTLYNDSCQGPDTVVHQSNSLATQYGRTGELLFEMKKKDLELKKEYNRSCGKDDIVDLECFSKKLVDYLFACLSILRISQSFKANAMISNSLIGHVYYDLSKAVEEYLLDKRLCDVKEDIVNTVNVSLTTDHFVLKDPYYYMKKADVYFERAVSMHSQGKQYENKLNDMVYLEDDFNDNSNHFGMALERIYVFSKTIDDITKKLRQKLLNDPVAIQKEELNDVRDNNAS